MSISRRHLLLSAGAAGLALAAPSFANAQQGGDARLSTLLDAFANELLERSPEAATGLGLDKGARARLKSKLSNRSMQAVHEDIDESRRRAHRLSAIERASLNGADAIRYDAVAYALRLGADAGAFDFGDNSFNSAMSGNSTPYVISQQTGVLVNIPEFLNSQHKIETDADCDAYLSRLSAFARQLDQETERVRRDTGHGVIAPSFILDTTLTQMTELRGQAAGDTGLVQSLATRAHAAGINGDYAARATRIVEREIFPAVDRQIEAARVARARANADAGVWKLRHGDEYYAWLLRVGTSTNLTAAEIHEMGREQGRAIDAQMDAILRAQGMTRGSVGERVSAMTRDPQYLKPNTDAGRAEVLAYLEGRIAAIRQLMPRISRMGLRAPVDVRRVPPDIQDGAALGYMNFAALDGSRPAIYYVNLKDTGNWPTWTLASLTAHEALPGHAWQGAYLAEHHAEIPLMFSLMGFNSFVEGWALYAEQLVDELGLYEADPLGRLGYLQAQRFRAARLVVDTGLHALQWSRDDAIASLIAQTGRSPGAAQSEIDRYIAGPGQACGYKVGHTEIVRLREKARTQLGARFDLRDFNDCVVRTGGVPLTVLETAVDAYIAGS